MKMNDTIPITNSNKLLPDNSVVAELTMFLVVNVAKLYGSLKAFAEQPTHVLLFNQMYHWIASPTMACTWLFNKAAYCSAWSSKAR